MINLFPKKNHLGAVTLIIAVILIVTSTLIIIFAANYGRMIQQTTTNQIRNDQAFEAAMAGMEYGINYLKENRTLVTSVIIFGFIIPISNSSITNVTLANGSRFTIYYTNPTMFNYNLIQITCVGTSDDGTATRTVRQQVQYGSILASPPTVSLTTKGSLTLGGSARITNLFTPQTTRAGGGVTITGAANTLTSAGVGSSALGIGTDIAQNQSSLATMSSGDFFASYFGVSSNTVKNSAAYYYSNNSNTNYSSTLNGMSGTSIWIDQTGGTATINGSVTIGTTTNPVLLIVNGDLDLSGSVTINGFIYVTGTTTTDILGSATVNGGIVSSSDFSMKGSTRLNYNPTILSNLQNQLSLSYFAKVPGSWRDF